MNRRYLLLFLVGFIFLLFVFKNQVLNFFNFLKLHLFEIQQSISLEITSLRNQSLKIKELTNENLVLKSKIQELNSLLYNCLDYKKLIKDSNLSLVKTISYANLPDFSEIYIDYEAKGVLPKGLVYNNLAAGIVVKRVGKYSLAFLNSNEKTSYTVFVIHNNRFIPGIFYGKENIIRYLPKFKEIKKGDLVITSGLDGVFYKGAKVGIVENVKETNLYQEAKVKLFYDDLAPNYFYVVEKYDRIRKKGGENGSHKH